MKATRLATALAIALVIVGYATSCSRSPGSVPANSAISCAQLLDAAVNHAPSSSVDINSVIQALSDNCSDEYDIAIDYLANATDGAFSIDSCDKLLGYGMRSEAVALLERDGHCSFGGTEHATGPAWPNGGVGWDQARSHAGSVQLVCGPLISARETADGTFLNVGQDYPSAGRFTFIFWDMYLDPIERGVIVCGSGEIYLYEGVAQMEMWDPTALGIWR